MTAFLKTAWHYLLLLGGVGAVSGLAAVGHLTSTAAGLIGGLAGGGGIGGLVSQTAKSAATTLNIGSTPSTGGTTSG